MQKELIRMVLPKFSGHLTINEIFTERSRKCLKDIGEIGGCGGDLGEVVDVRVFRERVSET